MRYIVFLLLSSSILFASLQEDIVKNKLDISYVKAFARINVQSSDGRIKPLDTLNMDVLNKLIEKKEFYGLNHNQVVLSMAFAPEFWKNVPMFAYKDKLHTYNYFYQDDIYTLMPELKDINLKEAKQRNAYEKDLLKLDEKLQVANYVYTKGYLKIFPLKDDKNKKWYSPKNYKETFDFSQAYDVQRILVFNKKALANNDITLAKQIVQKIDEFQKLYAPELLLSKEKVDAELFYNKILIFERIYPIYFLLSLLWLFLTFLALFKGNSFVRTKKILKMSFYLLFVLMTFNIFLRGYISSHAPWTNAYESMILIAWAILFVGFIFSKKSRFTLGVTSFIAGVMLFAAHLSWMDPRITTLSSSLQSIWLVIHVAVISISYAFLALSALLGLIGLILFNFSSKNSEVIQAIKESYKTNEASMLLGLSFLVIGTVLGSIWANESWGRIWAWDPKEAWSFISILVYMMILHLNKLLKTAQIYIFTLLSILGFSTILMTYFGVNYFFNAIHVYASDSASELPWYLYAVVASILILGFISFKERKNV